MKPLRSKPIAEYGYLLIKMGPPIFLLIALAALLVSSGCGKRDQEVRGQIFIVQEDRAALKLSLVSVDAITPDTAGSRRSLVSKEAYENMKLIDVEMHALNSEVEAKEQRIRSKNRIEIAELGASLKSAKSRYDQQKSLIEMQQ